eukprot:Lithocolla_globosa_v1_NODE_3352_length_1692_cov_11.784362.p1 type:complete len:315 gc:universal NODE_3352_length_1692_cov_11.784362:591-1535(+)
MRLGLPAANQNLLKMMNQTIIRRLFSSETQKKLLLKLRQETGISIGKCKNALVEHNNDYDKALKAVIKEVGAANFAKVAGRRAAEGLIALHQGHSCSTLLELNSETDFSARGEKFVGLATNVVESCSTKSEQFGKGLLLLNEEQVQQVQQETGVKERIKETMATLGENILLRRLLFLNPKENQVAGGYVHSVGFNFPNLPASVRLGRLGALVSLSVSEPAVLKQQAVVDVLNRTAIQIAQQVVATSKLKKEELGGQSFLFDSGFTVEEVLKERASKLGLSGIRVDDYWKMELGSEAEPSQNEDFAASVEKELKK